MKSSIGCLAGVGLCFLLAGLNFGLFLAHGYALSLISGIWAVAMGAWTGRSTYRCFIADVRMRCLDEGWMPR